MSANLSYAFGLSVVRAADGTYAVFDRHDYGRWNLLLSTHKTLGEAATAAFAVERKRLQDALGGSQ